MDSVCSQAHPANRSITTHMPMFAGRACLSATADFADKKTKSFKDRKKND